MLFIFRTCDLSHHKYNDPVNSPNFIFKKKKNKSSESPNSIFYKWMHVWAKSSVLHSPTLSSISQDTHTHTHTPGVLWTNPNGNSMKESLKLESFCFTCTLDTGPFTDTVTSLCLQQGLALFSLDAIVLTCLQWTWEILIYSFVFVKLFLHKEPLGPCIWTVLFVGCVLSWLQDLLNDDHLSGFLLRANCCLLFQTVNQTVASCCKRFCWHYWAEWVRIRPIGPARVSG